MFDAIKQGAPSISIHVPLRWGRPHLYMRQKHAQNFNPRPPTRGTTAYILHDKDSWDISIHVPLRGGRPQKCLQKSAQIIFQSTSPYAGDDTTMIITLNDGRAFQSTSPYAGDDRNKLCSLFAFKYFNPRPPTRGTTIRRIITRRNNYISIHVPLRGGRQFCSSAHTQSM